MTARLNMLTLVAIFLFSCKDKDAEKLQHEKYIKQQMKELIMGANKTYMYYCTIISNKTNLPLETVKPILKEYFIFKREYAFKQNTFIVIDFLNFNKGKHSYDLILETSKKYKIPFNEVVSVYCELETIEKIDKLRDELYNLENRIDDLESQLPKE